MAAPQFADHAEHLHAILRAALRAADPTGATSRAVRANPPQARRPALIAVGKAAPAMFAGYVDVAGEPVTRFMIAPKGVNGPAWSHTADHPLPTDRNIDAGRALEVLVEDHREARPQAAATDGFVLLLSGGASALMTLPESPLEVDDIREVTEALLLAGATIHDLNCVRKHIDRLKGGKLAALMSPLPCDVYVLSDVIGDDLSVIGSGPCAPDATFFVDALNIAKRAFEPRLRNRFHRMTDEQTREDLDAAYAGHAVLDFLQTRCRDGVRETPKPGDPLFDSVRHVIVANNAAAVAGAAHEAARLGFLVHECRTLVHGDAAEIGGSFAADARDRPARAGGPACFILGGETTVNVGAQRGKGGRNQEFALAGAIEIDGAPNVAVACFGTDGVDGPTDAAGAIVTGETCARARSLGLDPRDFLARHDSYTFFAKVGGHIKTGPTGTNVNDVAVALVY